ncbi:MAG: hypothetical protein KDJ41_18500, partial [Hyphomicrobiaceae bacterium]|nr:hypothetical protein [Hyphomicrobiaceae bacterium]
ATLPPADALPDDLLPLLNVNAMAFRSERDLEALVSVIDARLGDPPMGALGVRLMASRPDLSKASDYRFRAPTAPAELAPFVALSDEEPDIALSNPTLTGESRLGLYDRWCQWTAEDEARPWSAPGNRTRSFLILDQRQADGAWRSIAVSIVLPLSMRGGATLMGTSMEAAREPAAKRTAVTLEADDLSHTGSSCLLIDTWAVARRQSDGVGAVRRVNHHAWAIAMLLRHIAEFWSPTSPAPVTFMVEPNERVARVLFSLGFERRDRNALSGDLYFLEYPLNAYRYAPEARQAIEQILEAMRAAARFPVERSSDGA